MATVRPPTPRSGRVDLLDPQTTSLARGIPDCPEGTLFVLGDRGGIRIDPPSRIDILFGRNEPEVHVSLGADDPAISRRHGMLTQDHEGWTLRNTGGLPIRLPGARLLLSGHEEPIGAEYTPLFIRTQAGREHLLELRIATRTSPTPPTNASAATRAPKRWHLSDRERLVLTVLGERYLRHDRHPQPASWANAACTLAELEPQAHWTSRRVEWVATTVRRRLADADVPGLTRDEVGEPVGNALNHNLLTELLTSTALVPPDLRRLDRPQPNAERPG